MKHDIHFATLSETTRTSSHIVGIEIQPPISDGSVLGIAAQLTGQNLTGPVTGGENVAERVDLVRNDEAGTALLVERNHHGQRLSSEEIAEAIGALADPCGLHHFNYIDHDDHDTEI